MTFPPIAEGEIQRMSDLVDARLVAFGDVQFDGGNSVEAYVADASRGVVDGMPAEGPQGIYGHDGIPDLVWNELTADGQHIFKIAYGKLNAEGKVVFDDFTEIYNGPSGVDIGHYAYDYNGDGLIEGSDSYGNGYADLVNDAGDPVIDGAHRVFPSSDDPASKVVCQAEVYLTCPGAEGLQAGQPPVDINGDGLYDVHDPMNGEDMWGDCPQYWSLTTLNKYTLAHFKVDR